MANPAVVGTPIRRHKRALHTFFDGCTNHWNHPLDKVNWYKKSRGKLNPAKTENSKLTEYNGPCPKCQ
jgi:hypothetical protein